MRYVAEIALNKEGKCEERVYEIETPKSCKEVEDMERAMFDELIQLWEEYRVGKDEKGCSHLCCNFNDWLRTAYRERRNEVTIGWTTSRTKSEAHITIKNVTRDLKKEREEEREQFRQILSAVKYIVTGN